MTATESRVDCPHAESCAGCPRIELAYGEQLAAKRGVVADALAGYPELAALQVSEIAAADPIVGYRTRAKLVVAPGARIGLFAKGGGHEVVDIPGCRVLAPAVAEVAAVLRAWLRGADDEVTSALQGVDLREALDGAATGVLVTLICDASARPSERALGDAARVLVSACPRIAGVAASFRSGPQLLGRGLRVLAGDAMRRDRLEPAAPWTLAGHGTFAQVHRGEAARIHARILGALGDARGRNVLELFAGSGALGLRLAAAGARVTLVESFATALDGALEAARAQGIGGIEAEHGDASEVAAKLLAAGARFDAIVVNPPRRGLPPELRTSLAELAPPLVAYVSCEPTTLARDLAHLRRLGLAADAALPFDMIPLSAEVECLALLRPVPAPPPRVIYQDEGVIVVDKDPHEPTTPQGEHRGSLLARVRRLPGAANASPVHRLDLGTSGVCIFARDPASAAAWSSALAAPDTVKEYVALARGITRDKGAVARPLVESGRTQSARTRYRRERILGGHSLLRVRPDEGRTHQIRRHLAAIGHPILGDARHGHAPSNRHFFERHSLDRPFLHCAHLALVHPLRGERVVLDAEVPADLAAVLFSLDRVRAAEPA